MRHDDDGSRRQFWQEVAEGFRRILPVTLYVVPMGLAFGAARGFIIFVILYMFYVKFFAPDPNTQAAWIRDSASLPYLQSVGQTLEEFLLRVLPEDGSFPTTPRGGQPG